VIRLLEKLTDTEFLEFGEVVGALRQCEGLVEDADPVIAEKLVNALVNVSKWEEPAGFPAKGWTACCVSSELIRLAKKHEVLRPSAEKSLHELMKKHGDRLVGFLIQTVNDRANGWSSPAEDLQWFMENYPQRIVLGLLHMRADSVRDRSRRALNELFVTHPDKVVAVWVKALKEFEEPDGKAARQALSEVSPELAKKVLSTFVKGLKSRDKQKLEAVAKIVKKLPPELLNAFLPALFNARKKWELGS